jgi:quinol monooxygenase YgiN
MTTKINRRAALSLLMAAPLTALAQPPSPSSGHTAAPPNIPPAPPPPPPPPPPGPAYCVTYIEVLSTAAVKAAAMLRALRAASRKTYGSLRFDVLNRRARLHHFCLMETWKDYAALEASQGLESRRRFRDALQPLLAAGYDERPHSALGVADINAGARARGEAVYAVTHIDFIPSRRDEGAAALLALASASRTDVGNMRFEILQQNSRSNHFTMYEIWEERRLLEAHESTAHSVRFRELTTSMNLSLYDQRLYRLLD